MKHLLDFEKPYIDLQRRLEELREQPEETNVPLDIGDEIRQLEEKMHAKAKLLSKVEHDYSTLQHAMEFQRKEASLEKATLTAKFELATASYSSFASSVVSHSTFLSALHLMPGFSLTMPSMMAAKPGCVS